MPFINKQAKLGSHMSEKIVSEYDQEKTQSKTANNPESSWGRVRQQSRDTRETNKVKQPAKMIAKLE